MLCLLNYHYVKKSLKQLRLNLYELSLLGLRTSIINKLYCIIVTCRSDSVVLSSR